MKIINLIWYLPLLFSCTKDANLQAFGTTEEFLIASEIINDTYPIYVFKPENYDNNSLNQLIIALDGNTRFNSIAEIIAEKSKNGSMSATIFIAIGNNEQRNRDYTPTTYAHGAGGADKFYKFIKEELIPELEVRYKIDPSNNKTLIGHSFGGLFTHYVLAQPRATNPFNKFIASGASYWFDSGVIFDYEQTYATSHSDLNVTLYNGMGTLEGGVSIASFEEMNERLNNRSFPNFKHKSELIEQSGHSGSANKIFKKGLDYVFNK